MSEPELRYFPIFLDVDRADVLIVGGGQVCTRKAGTLMRYGARLTIVAPRVTAEIESWEREGRLTVRRKSYDAGDLGNARLVIASTDQESVNEAVSRDCRSRGIPVNVADVPALCDFIVPAVVDRGSVQIAISTGGSSPALARRIRETIEREIGPEYDEVADLLGSLRADAKATLPTDADRKRFFQSIVESQVLELLRRGDRKPALELLISICQRAGVPVTSEVAGKLR